LGQLSPESPHPLSKRKTNKDDLPSKVREAKKGTRIRRKVDQENIGIQKISSRLVV